MKIITTILLLRHRLFIHLFIHPSIYSLVLRKTSRMTLCEDQTIGCLHQLDRCCQPFSQMILDVNVSDSMFVFDALILLLSNNDHFENSKFLKLTAYCYKVYTRLLTLSVTLFIYFICSVIITYIYWLKGTGNPNRELIM
jgi:hypothetical protein